ncbi:MAG: hypothetical protein DRP71_03700 [Verrucomicrobia bacterium]|nr:MAG: hypothetical protein DRP71_03700 [Verrucomicrobiota bacterium]
MTGSNAAAGRRIRADTLAYAILAQVGLLLLTVFIVILRPSNPEDPAFEGKKTVRLPQRELDHRVAVAEFQQMATSPLQIARLATSALLPDGLPPMPNVPSSEFNPLENAEFLTANTDALLAQAGLNGALDGIKSAVSAAAFFGVEDHGERIVIVVNTSASVMRKARNRGYTIERIQAEVQRLINGLDSGTRFGIVQFSQGVRSFAPYVAPATASNRAAASSWIPSNLRGNPPVVGGQSFFGHEAAFEAAFELQPDVIFLITDGVLNRRTLTSGRVSYPEIPYETFLSTVRRLERNLPGRPRIHIIGFEMKKADAANMRRLASSFGGQLRSL